MHDVTEIDEPITIGNGNAMRATKVGKLRRTIHQKDGSAKDTELEECKCVPELKMNSFSVVKSLASGWKVGNQDVNVHLEKNGIQMTFDRTHKTKTGKPCGVDIPPRTGKTGHRDIASPVAEQGNTKEEPKGEKKTPKSTKTWDRHQSPASSLQPCI